MPSQPPDEDPISRGQRSLIAYLKIRYALQDPRMEAAFLAVPRHLFLPGVDLDRVYRDEVIVTHTVDDLATSSNSQPVVVAAFLEMLDPQPGENVLEIGAGTGWAAALVGHLVGPTGHVTTVDITEEVAAGARAHLAANGTTNVTVITGDGGLGYAANAPYDAILATVGVWDIPPDWLAQLKVGGRVVLPLWLNTMQFGAWFTKTSEDNTLELTGHSGTVGFMRLRGSSAGPDSFFYQDDYRIDSEITAAARLKELIALVQRGATLVDFPLAATRHEREDLCQFLALTNEPVLGLYDEKSRHGFQFGSGLLKGESLVMLPVLPKGEDFPKQIAVFGGREALDALCALAEKWVRLGKPSLAPVRIEARPLEQARVASFGTVIRKRWMEYEVGFHERRAGES